MNGILSTPVTYLAAAVVLGLVGGALFHGIWRRILPRSTSRAFWAVIPASARGMLTSEATEDLLHHYRTLVVTGLRYAGRNILAVLAAMAPVAAIALLLGALDPSARLAANIEVRPPMALAWTGGTPVAWRSDGKRMLINRTGLGDATVRLAGRVFDASALARKQALCTTTTSCLLFEMMLFQTHSLDSAGAGVPTSVVIRPLLLNRNPFWPYLNDLDVAFLVALMCGGAGAAWWSRERYVHS